MRRATNPILNYGREIIGNFIKKYAPPSGRINILDIGCGDGTDLLNSKKFINDNATMEMYGLEIDEKNAAIAQANGIKTAVANIESDDFPFPDNFFDIIVMNQVLEHTKEIFFIASEINRILKTDGLLIIGIPNLASFHNRILLLFGRQPTSIRTLGPHVRGFTKNDLVKFFNQNKFSLLKFAGANFYPFPKAIAILLSKLFPEAAVSNFFLFKKTGPAMTKEYLAEQHFETNFKI
ncbi:MAG: class I SAM-dependent methyltransferase [Candidatus Falkowbacteria bacterium]|nr:MAG: class I SAM-dependent methyltransferase [Candidatus Falkowbacteria bacterium]